MVPVNKLFAFARDVSLRKNVVDPQIQFLCRRVRTDLSMFRLSLTSLKRVRCVQELRQLDLSSF